jgi:hypothetical protein
MVSVLYLNGVFKSVLDEILDAQTSVPERVCYLQPYSDSRIKLLAESVPTPEHSVRLYISLTDSLGSVSYRASIIGWRDKREMSESELAHLKETHFDLYQPGENGVYLKGGGGQDCVNLLLIKHLELLPQPIPVSSFIKVSDGKPLKTRTRSGGWSYVQEPPQWVGTAPTVIADHEERAFQDEIKQSLALPSEARRARLQSASKLPEVVQVVSQGFRRNPDVVAEVLLRASGICERCHVPAPFNRASDGSPYLEVHHRVPLSQGGEDTIENAMALCPNCHRELHFGQNQRVEIDPALAAQR